MLISDFSISHEEYESSGKCNFWHTKILEIKEYQGEHEDNLIPPDIIFFREWAIEHGWSIEIHKDLKGSNPQVWDTLALMDEEDFERQDEEEPKDIQNNPFDI